MKTQLDFAIEILSKIDELSRKPQTAATRGRIARLQRALESESSK